MDSYKIKQLKDIKDKVNENWYSLEDEKKLELVNTIIELGISSERANDSLVDAWVHLYENKGDKK